MGVKKSSKRRDRRKAKASGWQRQGRYMGQKVGHGGGVQGGQRFAAGKQRPDREIKPPIDRAGPLRVPLMDLAEEKTMAKPDAAERRARRAWYEAMVSPKPRREVFGSWDGCTEAEKQQWRAAVAAVRAVDAK